MAYVFPEDLGDSQNGHAVGFTAYKSSVFAQTMGNVPAAMSGGLTEIFGAGNPVGSQLSSITTPQESVFMYVPAGGQTAMNWQQDHIYTDVKMARTVANFLGVGGALDAAGVGAAAGYAINPRIEVLFQTTRLREFDFVFLMAPQSENESMNMKSIIDTFRLYSAPRLMQGSWFFESPSEWKITFWQRRGGSWTENTNIPKIARGVISSVVATYPVPGGEYSTFSNGHPVSAMLSIKFHEMSIIHQIGRAHV